MEPDAVTACARCWLEGAATGFGFWPGVLLARAAWSKLRDAWRYRRRRRRY